MTISTNDLREEYTATASQTVFSFDFRVFADTDVTVYQTASGVAFDDAANIITAYSVSRNADQDSSPGGSITLTTGATAGDRITIVSSVPETRTTDYQVGGAFNPDTVDNDFDRVVSIAKQASAKAGRAMLAPESEQNSGDLALPDSSTRKDKLLGFDSSGSPQAIAYSQSTVTSTEVRNLLGDNVRIFPLTYTDGTGGLTASSVNTTFDTTFVAGDVIQTTHYDSNKTIGSGAKWQFTGTTTAGKAGTVNADGYVYDADGKQFRLSGEAFNVLAFGAKGDGATSDTNAVQYACNAASIGGGKVFFPEGVYLISSLSLKNGTYTYDGLILEGVGTSLNGELGTVLEFTNTSAPGFLIEAEDESAAFSMQIQVRDMQIKASTSSVNALMRLNRCQNTVLSNVYLKGQNGSSQTLLEFSQLVTIKLTDCFLRDANIGIENVDLSADGYTPLFSNVIEINNTFFDDLTYWAKDTADICRAWHFEGCTVEPAEDGSASQGVFGGYCTTIRSCWMGDADGTGTWITATGEGLNVETSEIIAADTAIDDQTTLPSSITGNILSGVTEAVRVASAKKSVVRNNRILLPANDGIGVHATAGSEHIFEDNDIAKSGTPTGTIGYQLDAGSRGSLRDRVNTSVATAISQGTPGNWTIDNRNKRQVGSVTTNIGSLSAGSVFSFNISVEGAVAGDCVALAPPAAIETGLLWSGVVSANGTVSVRIYNPTSGAIDPASATWKAIVFNPLV
jgi:hypothetical protein